MANVRIGSQEWRFTEGWMEHSDVMLYKATRCGISAPGRSADRVVIVRTWKDMVDRPRIIWNVKRGWNLWDTRAKAAAASYLSTVQPLTWDMVGEELKE